MRFEEIRKYVFSGKTIEEALERFDWKEFEQIVEEIFKSNNFKTYRNFRFKTKRRYEIDLIAIRNNKIFCIDCKEWGKGRHKKTGLKLAVSKQKERLKELLKFIKVNPILQARLSLNPKCEFYPLLVTLLQEDLAKENNTFIVPVWKLNSFLLEIEKYL